MVHETCAGLARHTRLARPSRESIAKDPLKLRSEVISGVIFARVAIFSVGVVDVVVCLG